MVVNIGSFIKKQHKFNWMDSQMIECDYCDCNKKQSSICCRHCEEKYSCKSESKCRLTFMDTDVECAYMYDNKNDGRK